MNPVYLSADKVDLDQNPREIASSIEKFHDLIIVARGTVLNDATVAGASIPEAIGAMVSIELYQAALIALTFAQVAGGVLDRAAFLKNAEQMFDHAKMVCDATNNISAMGLN